tara:strand:- start:81348 stop:82283 length:936 start_codon:yes stop_codon:yes gene_type:complete
MKIIVQMDPIESLNIKGDTTFALLIEAQNRGHTIDYYTPDLLTLNGDSLYAEAFNINITDTPEESISCSNQRIVQLEEYDVVLMRQDPPFDMSYITATYLLEHIRDKVLIINDPIFVRNCPEKIFVNKYKQFMPPTIITRNRDEIFKFREIHNQIIIKPLYGNGGAGVFYADSKDKNFPSIVEHFIENYKEQFIVQKFIQNIRDGDKRIILVNGKAIGAINRLPQKGEIRSNMHVGGIPFKTEITDKDKEICDTISSDLIKNGLFFVGIDVIDNYLTEINVTSPTGIREILKLSKIDVASIFWDEVENKIN